MALIYFGIIFRQANQILRLVECVQGPFVVIWSLGIKVEKKNVNWEGGGVGNFVERAQNKPKICDRMTGQTCTKIRKQTENRSNLYTKKNDFTAVAKGFGQGFGRSGRGHRPAECRQAEEGASPGKTKEPANARSTFAGSGSSGYTRAAP